MLLSSEFFKAIFSGSENQENISFVSEMMMKKLELFPLIHPFTREINIFVYTSFDIGPFQASSNKCSWKRGNLDTCKQKSAITS